MTFCFEIDLQEARYPVMVSERIILDLKAALNELDVEQNFYFIFDEFVLDNLLPESVIEDPFYSNRTVIPARKNNKTFYAAMRVFADLEAKNISRDVTVVAVGGGVIGDLSGFVASCWYRGVNLIHVPTTLLAAVDSCVGGKTALNFKSTVNAVGTYHHPCAIMIDTSLLLGLPNREVSSGFGEIIKYAALGEQEVETLLSSSNIDHASLAKLIGLSLKCKERFVIGDVKEGAKRLFLNFGHTIGHAVEFSTVFNGEEQLRHGEGVSLGMIAIFHISIELGLLCYEELERLVLMIQRFSLPTVFHASQVGLSREELILRVTNLAFKDKKRTREKLRLVVLNGWGNPEIYETPDRELIAHGVSKIII